MNTDIRKLLKHFEEQKDFFNARVKSGIELYRKGSAHIQVVDKDGKPVKGAVIEARQTKQAFKFGSNLFHLDELDGEEKNTIYKEKFAELFNLATLPFYWSGLEPEKDQLRYEIGSVPLYRRPPTDLCIEYCRQHDIEPKLHCLNYDRAMPEWTNGISDREYKERLLKRFQEISERYAHLIPMIEVTNETFLPGLGGNFFYDNDFCEWSYRQAEKFFPTNELIINEAFAQWDSPNAFTNRNAYYMQIQRMLEHNVPLHGIGLQCHCLDGINFRNPEEDLSRQDGYFDPLYMYSVMDKFAELNLPLQITEFSAPSYSWDEEDEAVQAELIKNMYSMFFSQKNMEAVIYWNIPDGYNCEADAGDMEHGWNRYYSGLLRYDMSEKPSYKMLKKLICEDWRTDAKITTNEAGLTSLRGFHGEYELTIHADGKTYKKDFHMDKKDIFNRVTITLD